MPEVVILLLAACGTALATGLGAIPVFVLGTAGEGPYPFPARRRERGDGVAAVLGLLPACKVFQSSRH